MQLRVSRRKPCKTAAAEMVRDIAPRRQGRPLRFVAHSKADAFAAEARPDEPNTRTENPRRL